MTRLRIATVALVAALTVLTVPSRAASTLPARLTDLEFSLLFSRPRPDGLTAETSVTDLFDAFRSVPRDDTLYERNLNAIMDRLLRLHGMPLSGQETNALRQIYRTFSERGYAIRYSPTYSDLMTATDRSGAYRSYLTSEAAFNVVRNLELANLVVPVVGDFGGPKAIRAIAV